MSENNYIVLDSIISVAAIAAFISLLVGICWMGELARFDAVCEVIAYAFISIVMGSAAAYGRYLMKYYWEDEEE